MDHKAVVAMDNFLILLQTKIYILSKMDQIMRQVHSIEGMQNRYGRLKIHAQFSQQQLDEQSKLIVSQINANGLKLEALQKLDTNSTFSRHCIELLR